MTSVPKAVPLLVAVVLAIAAQSAAASEGTGHWSTPAAPQQDATPCHVHSSSHSALPPAPHPGPVNYRCCMTGHDVAVLTVADFSQPSDGCAQDAFSVEDQAPVLRSTSLSFLRIPSTAPPGAALLRI